MKALTLSVLLALSINLAQADEKPSYQQEKLTGPTLRVISKSQKTQIDVAGAQVCYGTQKQAIIFCKQASKDQISPLSVGDTVGSWSPENLIRKVSNRLGGAFIPYQDDIIETMEITQAAPLKTERVQEIYQAPNYLTVSPQIAVMTFD